MIESEATPGSAGAGGGGGGEEADSILTHRNNLALCTILKLLRTIAVDGFRY